MDAIRNNPVMFTLLFIMLILVIVLINNEIKSNKLILSNTTNLDDWETLINTEPEYSVDNPEEYIVYFYSYDCPYCESINQELEKLKEYNINIHYYHRSFENISSSIEASIAAECSKDFDLFFEYHNRLFENVHKIDQVNFLQIAKEIGVMDTLNFKKCLDDTNTLKTVEEDLKLADSLGINSVPTLIVNGYMFKGVANSRFIETLFQN